MKGHNEIVIFSVGSRSAVSSPGEENFILAKNLSLDGKSQVQIFSGSS
jgi:hypothetical protein